MKLCLQIAGILQLLLALAHFAMPRRLGWVADLSRVSLLTRQVFWVHLGFLMLTLAGFGAVTCWHADELLQRGALPRAFLGGLAFFWLARLYCQFFVYRRELWQGNPLRTTAHYLFATLWAFLACTYAAAFRLQF